MWTAANHRRTSQKHLQRSVWDRFEFRVNFYKIWTTHEMVISFFFSFKLLKNCLWHFLLALEIFPMAHLTFSPVVCSSWREWVSWSCQVLSPGLMVSLPFSVPSRDRCYWSQICSHGLGHFCTAVCFCMLTYLAFYLPFSCLDPLWNLGETRFEWDTLVWNER